MSSTTGSGTFWSWVPNFQIPNITLPSLSLPSSIQRRFLSFLLRRTLGHLLKPGQLDIDQVDSQIGSGFVEVKNLELDPNAINKHLHGLAAVKFVSGLLGTATIRIPWPNPLSSTLGLSISGLRLEFAVTPITPTSQTESTSPNLADSVASVAESFLHDELTDREEALLRESVHANAPDTLSEMGDFLPGAIDPFVDGPGQTRSTGKDGEADPEGISIFASLFENLLSRFEFVASDLQVKIVNPNNSAFTLIASDFHYATEGQDGKSEPARGQTRVARLKGFKVLTQDLTPPRPPSSTPLSRTGTLTPTQSKDDGYDSSDMDEETQMMMSQSVLSLPPVGGTRVQTLHDPTTSTISSASSSMYESAVSSGLPAGGEEPHLNRPDELILSIGSDALTISVTTPPPYQPLPDQAYATSTAQDKEYIKVSISMGHIAIALSARHVSAIVALSAALSTIVGDTRPVKTPPEPSQGNILDQVLFSFKSNGVVALILSSTIDPHLAGMAARRRDIDAIVEFFDKPSVPPRLPHGYLRFHLDSINALYPNNSSSTPVASSALSRTVPFAFGSSSMTCNFADISLIAFRSLSTTPSSSPLHSSDKRVRLQSFPVLITDPNLPSTYAEFHAHPANNKANTPPMPTFEVSDWTSSRSTHRTMAISLKQWRTKLPHRRTASAAYQGGVSNVVLGLSSSPPTNMMSSSPRRASLAQSPNSSPIFPPEPASSRASPSAISIDVTFGQGKPSVDVQISPLHLFIDVELLSSVLSFLADIDRTTDNRIGVTEGEDFEQDDLEYESESPSMTPRVLGGELRNEKERRRLERILIEDLDLEMDYRESALPRKPTATSRPGVIRKPKRKSRSEPQMQFSLQLSLLRIEARVPPPPEWSARSGALVFDLHAIAASSAAPVRRLGTRFEDVAGAGASGDAYHSNGKILAFVETGRILLAYSPAGEGRATGVASIGSLDPQSVDQGLGISLGVASPAVHDEPRCLPTVLVTSSEGRRSSTALVIDIPFVYLNLIKPHLDGLQFFTDDLSQWAERAFSEAASDKDDNSRYSSLIGSRFFAKRGTTGRSDASTASATFASLNNVPAESQGEFVVKTSITETFVRLNVPSAEANHTMHTLDLSISNLDALVEVKPEGKDETIVTLGLRSLRLAEGVGGNMRVFFQPVALHPTQVTANPVVKVRFQSLIVPETTAKESRVKLTLHGFVYDFVPNIPLFADLATFFKAPPGVFESVVPSERTRLSLKVIEGSVRVIPPSWASALTICISELELSTDLVGGSAETTLQILVPGLSVFLGDEVAPYGEYTAAMAPRESGKENWKASGYALLTEVENLNAQFTQISTESVPESRLTISSADIRVHMCADSISGIAGFAQDLQAAFPPSEEQISSQLSATKRRPIHISPSSADVLEGVDEQAFKRQDPETGPAADMIYDDLPRNADYLDASFGAAAGLRELEDDDLEDFTDDTGSTNVDALSADNTVISKYGGETVRMFVPSLNIVDDYYAHLPPEADNPVSEFGETKLRIRASNCDVRIFLYEGYDWNRTRKTIQDGVKQVRKRLAKIRQLLASGQTLDPDVEETNALLFNSVYVGLDEDVDELEPTALIAAIDEELKDDVETASLSSWQSFKPQSPGKPQPPASRFKSSRLKRSRSPNIEFCLLGLSAEFDQYKQQTPLVTRVFVTIKDLEIVDHMKTSTWSKFLTYLRTDFRGNTRETDSCMVRVELRTLLPAPGHPEQESRFKVKVLPLRLHVDQDALDFMKKFFSFKDTQASGPASPSAASDDEMYFQHVEIFPVDIKLDYKPRRVDFRALREGKTIELMNFFHFDGSEMTLRHITLKGIVGWPRLGETLNDLWTPDVKANQLADVISGVSPIRSAVNVGSGVADLVLLPIAQYKKDGRVIRGLQKGTKAFVKSTALEAMKLGAQLATGTQVILEHAEAVLGGQYKDSVTAEAVQLPPPSDDVFEEDEDMPARDLISKYAEQPANLKEGVQTAYKTLSKNLISAGQTILAVPMEVYERSGNEGPARAVVRAVPIAALKPMIGATEAVSKTLLGLRNTLDPNIPAENEAKYKQR